MTRDTRQRWHRTLDDSIPLPNGGKLRTLRDAANYWKLPERDHERSHGARRYKLMLLDEHGGDTMMPRIGVMRALYPSETAPTPRKKRGEEISDR